MYVGNAYNYFHDFRRPVKCATIKIEVVIENGRSLKLRQTRQVDASILLQASSIAPTNDGRPTPMGLGKGCRSGQRG